jgi:F-type H+-transporting ATPase subunit a
MMTGSDVLAAGTRPERGSRASRFRVWLYLSLAILSLVAGLAINLFFGESSSEITVSGAQVYFTVPMPIQDLPITESQVNSALVVLFVLFLCLFLTEGMKVRPTSKRQLVAEMLVEKAKAFVESNMGKRFSGFSPFVVAIMGLSAFSSLLSLLGLYSPTSDINIVGGWAILVFVLITYYKLRGGLLTYLKGFTEPVAILTPFNVVSELATPVSMAFRHYGNVLSGAVISTMIYAALAGLSSMVLGWLPGFLGEIPFLQVGLPAVLSIYFDVFSGCLQAFIFAMLTMLYIATAAPEES